MRNDAAAVRLLLPAWAFLLSVFFMVIFSLNSPWFAPFKATADERACLKTALAVFIHISCCFLLPSLPPSLPPACPPPVSLFRLVTINTREFTTNTPSKLPPPSLLQGNIRGHWCHWLAQDMVSTTATTLPYPPPCPAYDNTPHPSQ